MLLEAIQRASLEARKTKQSERATLLVTLYAESARIGKDAGNRVTTDEEVVKVVRKFLKGIEESLVVLPAGAARDKAIRERDILEEFLPQQVSGAALAAVVAEEVSKLSEKGPKQMGQVMAAIKARLGGSFDGKEASALVKEALT